MAKRWKLKKEEFPEALRYSRERFWVKRTGEDSLRLGIALPAVQEPLPSVYFFYMRNAGYIATGKKFGFVDLDTGRYDLVAPMSGRIAQVNQSLLEDPGKVATDCFGEGWLCDLTRVLPEAIEALLDRDSFYGWLKFERDARKMGLDPTISCSHRVVEGVPWPEDVVFRIGGRVVARSRPVREGRNETFTPQWYMGQSWRVLTEFEQPSMAKIPDPKNRNVKRTWLYEVVDEFGEVGGESCWVLKVTEVDGPPPLTYALLYIARNDFSLRMVEEVNSYDPTSRSRMPNDWGAESYIELRRPREMILDLPLFPPENQDEKREVKVGTEPPLTVETRFPDPKHMAIAIEAPVGRVAGETIRSEQVWERGLPWWREARRTTGSRTLITGKLV